MVNLTEYDKDIFRKKIEERIKFVPFEEKIHIDKELLEALIFYTRISKKGNLAKYPIWTGDFLKRIDLDEISFDNVVWNLKEDESEKNSIFGKYTSPIPINYQRLYENAYNIDLSKTNACIDFSKSFEVVENNRKVFLNSCNLSKTNLKDSNIEFVRFMLNSDISHSKLAFNFNCYSDLSLCSCNLEGLNLSNIEIESSNLLNHPSNNLWVYLCNLKNTKIKIICKNMDRINLENLSELIVDGFLDGCYINNKLIDNDIKKKIYNIM